LAKITEYIQTNGPDNIALRSSERGRFQLESDGHESENDQLIVKLIKDAAEAGFLRMFVTEDSRVQFQVHHSLAAKYNFSYRGAYYATMINAKELVPLVLSDNQTFRTSSLNALKRKLARDDKSKQISLFDYAEDSI